MTSWLPPSHGVAAVALPLQVLGPSLPFHSGRGVGTALRCQTAFLARPTGLTSCETHQSSSLNMSPVFRWDPDYSADSWGICPDLDRGKDEEDFLSDVMFKQPELSWLALLTPSLCPPCQPRNLHMARRRNAYFIIVLFSSHFFHCPPPTPALNIFSFWSHWNGSSSRRSLCLFSEIFPFPYSSCLIFHVLSRCLKYMHPRHATHPVTSTCLLAHCSRMFSHTRPLTLFHAFVHSFSSPGSF